MHSFEQTRLKRGIACAGGCGARDSTSPSRHHRHSEAAFHPRLAVQGPTGVHAHAIGTERV